MKPPFNLEAELSERQRRAKAFLPVGQHAEFDVSMSHISEGHHGRTMLWQSLSPAQRRLVQVIPSDGAVVRTSSAGSRYRLAGPDQPGSALVGWSTIRKLVEHGLMSWAGTADDPEGHAALTGKGRDLVEAMRGRH